MLKNTLILGSLALGFSNLNALALPDGIKSAYLCTQHALHGDIDNDLYVKLLGDHGQYDSDQSALNPFGSLTDIHYFNAENAIEGKWSNGTNSGWFRWAFYDDSGFYGSWGYGDQVATNEQGYWNGEVCTP